MLIPSGPPRAESEGSLQPWAQRQRKTKTRFARKNSRASHHTRTLHRRRFMTRLGFYLRAGVFFLAGIAVGTLLMQRTSAQEKSANNGLKLLVVGIAVKDY